MSVKCAVCDQHSLTENCCMIVADGGKKLWVHDRCALMCVGFFKEQQTNLPENFLKENDYPGSEYLHKYFED